MTQNKTQIDFCPYKCDCDHKKSINNIDFAYGGIPVVLGRSNYICDLDIYHERKKLCPMMDGPTQ
jgi:hypothetical protein